MSELKHTPGPWEVFENDDELMVIQSGSLESGAGWIGYMKVASELQGVDDASLISAAPELLEALQAALEWIDAVPGDTPLPAMPGFDRDWVNEVISKATGE